jgi:pilus assembly protein CpaD
MSALLSETPRHTPAPSRLARLALAVATAALVAGCNTTSPSVNRVVSTDYPIDLRQRHPITIAEGSRAMEILVGQGRGHLNDRQRADVMSFAGDWRDDGTGGVVIAVPSGTPNEVAAHDAARAIRAALVETGVPAHAIQTRAYRPADQTRLASVRVSYARLQASAGPCGLWPQDLGVSAGSAHTQNLPYWNFGCASQRNLAAMVDNPMDLVQPRAETPIYAGKRTTAIEKWRKGEDPATQYNNQNRGAVSEVGR